MKPVRLSAKARADLAAIADHIALDNPRRAGSFTAELRRRCDSLGRHAFQGRPVPQIGDGVRCLAYRRYLILYRPLDDAVAIDRIVHGARDLRAIFGRDPIDR